MGYLTAPDVPQLDHLNRACPGKDLAHSHMFITIAMILAVYTIGKPKNERGEEVEPVCEFLPGTVRCATSCVSEVFHDANFGIAILVPLSIHSVFVQLRRKP